MKFTEHNIQASCIKWFRWQHPNCLIFAVPNERKQSIIKGVRMKAIGLTAGVPDLVILIKGRMFFVEMKAPKGKLSENQKEIHKRLTELEYCVYTCYSLDEFIKVVNSFNKKTT